MLFRSSDASTPAIRAAQAAVRRRTLFSTGRRRQHEQIPQRYGPANEPPPHLGGGKSLGPSTRQSAEEQKKLPKIGQELQKDGEDAQEGKTEEGEDEAEPKKQTEPTTVDGSFARPLRPDPMLESSDSTTEKKPPESSEQPEDAEEAEEAPTESVLDSVPDPTQFGEGHQEASPTMDGRRPLEEGEAPNASPDEHTPPVRAPHIEPPQHVHHFDTYGLVKRLVDAGWDDTQAITIMKFLRLMLADNIDLARDALVSKSMVENETYLFRAACAELKTEVTTRRKAEQEKMRTERTQLQHEVDILGQRLGQEAGAMKDELKGMFDDRKMAVRNEQRDMESKVQQLNYKITVNLQADSRSEIEGLRWVMTRRVIIALGVVVVMVIGSLRLASNQNKEAEIEAKRRANMKSAASQTDSRSNEFIGGGPGERSGIGGGEIMVREGDNPAFVSLG